jgi:HK97 family phage portal protein
MPAFPPTLQRKALARVAERINLETKKASNLAAMRFPAYGASGSGYAGSQLGSWWSNGGAYLIGTLPGGERDVVADAGDVWLNGAVGACLGWISDNFTQPELQVVRKKGDGLYDPIDDHGLVQLLEEPNPDYDTDALWAATVLSFVVSGSAYWIKAKAPAGSKMYLWYAPHWEIVPKWERDGKAFVTGYDHVVDGRRYPLEKDQVVHFRRGLDPANTRSGLPQLGAVLREVATDNAGSVYSYAILNNMGMPGVLISPADKNDQIPEDEQKVIKQLWKERTTGDQRGMPLVNSVPLKIERLTMSPEDLALDKMRTFPEDRICSAMKLSPMVVGLTSGAEHKTYANYGEALRAAWDNCMVPLQRTFAKALTRQLLIPDLGGIKGKEFVEFDYENVPAMAEDLNSKATRAALLFEKKVIKRGKACEMINEDCDPDDDVYYGEPSIGQEPVVPPALRPFAGGGNGQPGANGNGQPALGPDGLPIDPNAPADQTPLRKPPLRIAKALEAAERAKAKAAAHNGHKGGPAATDAATGLLEAEDDALAALEAELGLGADTLAPAAKDVFSSASFPSAPNYRTLRRIREHARRRLKGEAEAFLAAYGSRPKADGSGASQKAALAEHLSADVRSWFAGIKALLTSLYRSAAAALLGGEVREGDAEVADIERASQAQFEYLDGFESATLDGAQPLDGSFANRAELYGAATWGVAQDVVRAKAIRDGMLYERRVHGGPDLPCDTCSEQQGQGWQPINTLKTIGDSPCGSNCHCTYIFTATAPGGV